MLKIGEILVEKSVITPEQRDYILKRQENRLFGKLAIWYKFAKDTDIAEALSYQTGWPIWKDIYAPIARERITFSSKEKPHLFSIDNILKYQVLPINYKDRLGFLYVNPKSEQAFQYVVRKKGINPGTAPRFIIPEYQFDKTTTALLLARQ